MFFVGFGWGGNQLNGILHRALGFLLMPWPFVAVEEKDLVRRGETEWDWDGTNPGWTSVGLEELYR